MSAAVSTLQALVVEDDGDVRRLLGRRLSDLGFAVTEAASGEAAVAALDVTHPDLVVLDVLLPGIDGWEVAHHLRGDPATAQVPVLVSSILAPDALPEWLDHASTMPKPFHRSDLIRAVAGLMGGSST